MKYIYVGMKSDFEPKEFYILYNNRNQKPSYTVKSI